MEPIFENVTVPTEDMYISLFQVAHKKYRMRNLIVWCISVVCIGYLLWHLGSPYRWSLVLLGPFYLYLIIKDLTAYRRTGKQVYIREWAYYDHTMPPSTFRFYPEYMESRDADSVHITPYRKLARVECLDKVIILARKDEKAFVMDPRGFTKGDAQEFARFIREKISTSNLPKET